MAATVTALHFLKSGDHILCTNDCVRRTERILRTYRDTFNFQLTYVNMADLDSVRAAIQSNTKMLWIETPSNPLLNVIDIQALSSIAHEAGALAAVDNTFLLRISSGRLNLGADSYYSFDNEILERPQ